MKTSFTPGPWVESGGRFVYAVGAMVADCNCSTDDETDLSPEEVAANARLIAAAPNLYAAVLLLLDDDNSAANGPPETRQSNINYARTALKKARGEA